MVSRTAPSETVASMCRCDMIYETYRCAPWTPQRESLLPLWTLSPATTMLPQPPAHPHSQLAAAASSSVALQTCIRAGETDIAGMAAQPRSCMPPAAHGRNHTAGTSLTYSCAAPDPVRAGAWW